MNRLARLQCGRRRKFGSLEELHWLIIEQEVESAMRDGEPCPVHGWTRQNHFPSGWHWVCCGRYVPNPERP